MNWWDVFVIVAIIVLGSIVLLQANAYDQGVNDCNEHWESKANNRYPVVVPGLQVNIDQSLFNLTNRREEE